MNAILCKFPERKITFSHVVCLKQVPNTIQVFLKIILTKNGYLEELDAIAKQMAERLLQLESEHYDINYTVRQKDFEINELTISVNDLRGKLWEFQVYLFTTKCLFTLLLLRL